MHYDGLGGAVASGGDATFYDWTIPYHLASDRCWRSPRRSVMTPKFLRAGAWTAHFDPENGQLRRIACAGREVVRGVYGAIRDRAWGTVAPRLENTVIEHGVDGFRVTFTAHCERDEIVYCWHGELIGRADSVLRYTFRGEAQSTFLRSRIGLCVLHPIRECAGKVCHVTHSDGSTESTRFPGEISADQPFFDVAALRHEVAEGLDALVEFRGDVFETEDQRNWTDASYKTYGTPLELPYPVQVHQGAKVFQEVTLRLIGDVPSADTVAAREPVLSVGARLTLPRLGFSHIGRLGKLNDVEVERLRALRPGHLRIELRLSDDGFSDDLAAAADDAHALDAPLQVALILSGDAEAELPRLLDALRSRRIDASEWMVFHRDEESTSDRWVQRVRQSLQEVVPAPRIGVGTNGDFAELNRYRPPVGSADFLTYSVNPQVHATDHDSIVEALAGQSDTARSARSFAGPASIHVGPITLKPRSDWRGGPYAIAGLTEVPRDADVRQATAFLAGWTLGSIAALAREGAAAATYYELTGCRGLVGVPTQAALPEPFATIGADVFPVYHLFADLAELADAECKVMDCELPDAFAGLLFRRADGMVALLANLTSSSQRWTLPFRAGRVRVHSDSTQNPPEILDPWLVRDSAHLELPAHSYVRAEGVSP